MLIFFNFPWAIEIASDCFVSSLACFNLSVYFLVSVNFKGSSLGRGVSKIVYSLLSKNILNLSSQVSLW